MQNLIEVDTTTFSDPEGGRGKALKACLYLWHIWDLWVPEV